jgi:hypothetical protein
VLQNVPTGEQTAPDRFPAREYVRDFAAECTRALAAAGPLVHDLRIGGVPVRLCFAGPALVPAVLPALAHLRADTAGPEPLLTVELWDAASTGVIPPPYPVPGDGVPARGEVRAYADAGVRALYHSGVRPRDGGFAEVTIFDERASIARYFVDAPDRIPWYERAAPLRSVLHWGLTGPDRLLVHAGAVGIGDRGVLLAGPGGSGKSTSAVAALIDGYQYLGDDYVLVDLAGPDPVAHSIYATAKLAPEATSLLPALSGTYGGRTPGGQEKWVIDVAQLRPGGLGLQLRIAAIVLPCLRPDAPTRLRPASAGAALLALAPTTVFQGPLRDGVALGQLAELAKRVPAHVLELGAGPEQVGPIISQLLEGGS